MECEVHYVIKNVRYRLLKVEGKTYLLDMDRSIWITLFPFLIWSLPNPLYQIDQEELNEKLQISNNKKKINKGNTLLLSGVGIFIANLLRPLGDYFNVSSTPVINVFFTFTFYFNNYCITSLYK
ncbi:DUF443 family protein [Paraliobacillus sp. JSM ZJ581]|uniref:DUF443 family protein n=1 Tax=Paraliobacillus sp. JSM ZJ581 TaxID=3342118 RepID=UPI0035A85432